LIASHKLYGVSPLNVTVRDQTDCIDLAAQQSHCTVNFSDNGRHRPVQNASGTLAFTETIVPVLADASAIPSSSRLVGALREG